MVEELVANTRDDGTTWMNYCWDIRNDLQDWIMRRKSDFRDWKWNTNPRFWHMNF